MTGKKNVGAKGAKQSPDIPRRGPGKPPKGDDGRTVSFHARITRNEYELWKKLAERADISLSEFILRPIREKHPSTKSNRKKNK